MVHLVLLQHLATDHAAVVHDHVEVGPRAELALPVGDGGEWRDDEEGAADAHALDLLQECDGLDGLAQAHFVGQDAVTPAWTHTKTHRDPHTNTHAYRHTQTDRHTHTLILVSHLRFWSISKYAICGSNAKKSIERSCVCVATILNLGTEKR